MAKRHARKRKLVRLDLQFKVVFITLFVTSLVLLINFQLNLAGMASLASRYPDSSLAQALIEEFKGATMQKFLLSVGMAIPLAASVGVLYSFKFCGPIFRFKQFFLNMTKRWDEPLRLRKGDDLQDVCEAINTGVGSMRARLRANHRLLADIHRHLETEADLSGREGDRERRAILAAIAEEDAIFREKFRDEIESGADQADSPRSERAETAAAEPCAEAEVAVENR